MILTKKIRIYPDQSARRTLWSVSHLCKEVWNVALEQRRDRKSWGKVGVYSQKKELTDIKTAFPEYKKPSSQVLQNVIFSLDAGYKMFFTKFKKGDKTVAPPGFKSYRDFFTQEYSQRDVSFKIRDGRLLLSYGSRPPDWISVDLPSGGYETVKTCKIAHDPKKNLWWALLTYEMAEKPKKEEGTVIYFDPGCKTALTGIKTSGEFFEYDISLIREINMESLKFLDGLISERDRRKKGSRRWSRLNKRISNVFDKINTRTKMYLHTVANKIIADHPDVKAFKIGDWKKQETLADTGFKSVNRRINRAVQNNNPLGKLIDILTYKAKLEGQEVSKFDERGSTRTCVSCGKVHDKGISPSVRTFKCEGCGFSFGRDQHSCLNFVKKHEAALWQRLSEAIPDSSRRTSFGAFSCKPRVAVEILRQAS